LGNIRTELRGKASVNRVDQVEVCLTDFVTKEQLTKTSNRLESYTTLENFNKSRIAQERLNNEWKARFENIVTQDRLADSVEAVKKVFNELNESNSQKRDCLKDKKSVEKQFEKLQKELLDLRDDHRNSKDRIRNLETMIGEKVEKFELADVKQFLALLPTKEEVTTLRTYMK